MNIKPSIKYEFDYIKVVYEHILSKIRINKKIIEKDLSTIILKLSQIKKKLNNDLSSSTNTLTLNNSILQENTKIFQIMIKKLDDLDKKYEELSKEEDILLICLEERLSDVFFLSKATSETDISLYCEKKMKNLILDFLLREKYIDTASNFIKEEKLSHSVEFSIYQEILNILECVKNKSLSEALIWCNNNKSKLSKINSNIKFKILKNQLCDMIVQANNKNKNLESTGSSKELLDCIKFARENFNISELSKEETTELEQILIYLISNKNEEISCNKMLEELIINIKNTFFNLYSFKSHSSLEILFQSGLIALKTCKCNFDKNVKNLNCPLCSENIFNFAKKLPSIHQQNSTLLCRKTKQIIDEKNYPLSTNQGYFYCVDSILNEINTKGKFYCPEENKEYKLDELTKIFVN